LEYEVASSPASEHSLQGTLVQGYLAACPQIFFRCPYITRVVVTNHSPEVSYCPYNRDNKSQSMDKI